MERTTKSTKCGSTISGGKASKNNNKPRDLLLQRSRQTLTFLWYVRSRKPAREDVGLLEDKGVKALIKDNREMAGKVNE